MARLPKKGLLYFNIDCEQEDNLNYIEAKHGLVGYGVVVKLWKKIYQFQGYYCDWNEKNMYLFARDVNVDVNLVSEIVETCFEEKIFSRGLFEEYQILTSSGVQKRWKKIVIEAKRKDTEIERRYCLLPLPHEIISITPENSLKTPEEMQQSKENQTKEDQIEEVERGEETAASPPFPRETGNDEDVKNTVLLSQKQILVKKEKNSHAAPKFARPGFLEVQDYFISSSSHVWNQNMARSQADLFVSHYEANGWVQNHGKPIVNWKAAAYGWILRELKGDFRKQQPASHSNIKLLRPSTATNVKTDIEYMYATFLDGTFKMDQLDTSYYDYLKKSKLINFSNELISQIKEKARVLRMQSLIGSNLAEENRIFTAYEKGLAETNTELIKDRSVFYKVVKRLAVIEFFQQLRDSSRINVFN